MSLAKGERVEKTQLSDLSMEELKERFEDFKSRYYQAKENFEFENQQMILEELQAIKEIYNKRKQMELKQRKKLKTG